MAHIEDRWYRSIVVDGRSTLIAKPASTKARITVVRLTSPRSCSREAWNRVHEYIHRVVHAPRSIDVLLVVAEVCAGRRSNRKRTR